MMDALQRRSAGERSTVPVAAKTYVCPSGGEVSLGDAARSFCFECITVKRFPREQKRTPKCSRSRIDRPPAGKKAKVSRPGQIRPRDIRSAREMVTRWTTSMEAQDANGMAD
jgi:hypothetical protein